MQESAAGIARRWACFRTCCKAGRPILQIGIARRPPGGCRPQPPPLWGGTPKKNHTRGGRKKNTFWPFAWGGAPFGPPANLTQRCVFREGFFTGKWARASNARPYILCDGRLWVFDTLRPYYL